MVKNIIAFIGVGIMLLALASCECGLECKNMKGLMQIHLYNNPSNADNGIKIEAYSAGTGNFIDSLVQLQLSSFTNEKGSGVYFNASVSDSMYYKCYFRNQQSPFLILSNVTFKSADCKSCGKKYNIEVLDNISTATNYTVERSENWLFLY